MNAEAHLIRALKSLNLPKDFWGKVTAVYNSGELMQVNVEHSYNKREVDRISEILGGAKRAGTPPDTDGER